MITPDTLGIGILAFISVLLAVWVFLLERKIVRLLAGKGGALLEDAINENKDNIDELIAFRKEAENEFRLLDGRIKKKLHGAKTLRFNPFAGTGSGGNQSFATALVDENGDGVVISTLYSREKVSVFAKPISDRKSEFELTEEESTVLKD